MARILLRNLGTEIDIDFPDSLEHWVMASKLKVALKALGFNASEIAELIKGE